MKKITFSKKLYFKTFKKPHFKQIKKEINFFLESSTLVANFFLQSSILVVISHRLDKTSKYSRYFFCFISYLVAPRPILGHWQGDNITQKSKSIHIYLFNPKVSPITTQESNKHIQGIWTYNILILRWACTTMCFSFRFLHLI